MNNLSDDLDPRLVILPVEAWYKEQQQRDPVNGVLVLSRAGFHFYGQRFDSSHKKFVDIEPEHIAFPDVQVTTGVWTSTPVIQATVYDAGATTRNYNVGFTKAIGRGNLGEMAAGIGNLSKQFFTGDKRATFITAVEEMKKRAPAFERSPYVSDPYFIRFRYFANASAFGPALALADKAQRSLLGNSDVKRERAWLLLQGQRYRQLVEESWKKPEKDAEVLVIYGYVNVIAGARDKALKMLEKAQQLEPKNIRVQAASAWRMAMQGMSIDSRSKVNELQESAENDQWARLLLGCACEFIGDYSKAIEHYIASASLAHGYIEGTTVTRRILSLANVLNARAGLQIMQQFAQAMPEQREAWKGLALAARRASDQAAMQQAQERLTTMESAAF
jgi:tetratricopeptide (TPR) repeat protein